MNNDDDNESYVLKIAKALIKYDEELPETHLRKLTSEERAAILLIYSSPEGFIMTLGILEQVCINNMAVYEKLQQVVMTHLEFSSDNVENQRADPKATKH